MVIIKVPIIDVPGDSTVPYSCTKDTSMPSSQTSEKVKTSAQSRVIPSISSGFKIHCLGSLLAFIKNDGMTTKEFPELNAEQAKFMHSILDKQNTDVFDRNKNVQQWYKAFVDAIKINELKYEFTIKCVESWGGKKSVVFSKIPIDNMLIRTDTAGETQENPKTDIRNTEDAKTGAPNTKISKTDDKSQTTKIDLLLDTTKPQDSTKYVPKQDDLKLQGLNMDLLEVDALKSNCPTMGELHPEVPKSEPEKKDAPRPQDPNTVVSVEASRQPNVGEPWFAKPELLSRTKKSKEQIKNNKFQNFLNKLPKSFIEDSLKLILNFLLDDETVNLVLVPKTQWELKFFRKCIDWCSFGQFGDEFSEFQSRISQILRRFNVNISKGDVNKFTRYREVRYQKSPKKPVSWAVTSTETKDTSNRGESESTPKNRKVNLQRALLLTAMDNIKLDKVINLNQSLRSKKKDKKRKKAELRKAKDSKGASSSSSCSSRDSSTERPKSTLEAPCPPQASKYNLRSKNKDTKRKKAELRKAKDSKGASSSSSCSSRDSSTERPKSTLEAPCPPQASKYNLRSKNKDTKLKKAELRKAKDTEGARRPAGEISQNSKTASSRLTEMIRKEQLIEAMSVPVQSEKARRMMLGMGWDGGALGTRGDGITEPLMPMLELANRAGLGLTSHRTKTQKANPEPVPKNPKESNTPLPFIPESDIVTQKCNNKEKYSTILGTKMKSSEPINSNEPLKQTSKVDLPNQSFKIANADLKDRLKFRLEILHSIWELLNSDSSCKSLSYDRILTKKKMKFVNLATNALSYLKHIPLMFRDSEMAISRQIQDKCAAMQVKLEARFFWDCKSVDLLKLPKKIEPKAPQEIFENKVRTEMNIEKTQVITNEDVLSYIFSTDKKSTHTQQSFGKLKFKILFLMNVLKFVQSLNEEAEITFNKALSAKEMTYIENVVDEINMKVKFGSSPAENKLSQQIKEHLKDAFLGVMHYHEFIVITLSKHFRFKRLNRPDNVVKRTTQITINLDNFTSETLIEPRLNTHKPINKKIVFDDIYEVSEETCEVTETVSKVSNECGDDTSEALQISSELVPDDSDDSSVEEYSNNKANAEVPKVLPGEEGVNLLNLYDKEKTNTAGIRNNCIINNNSASNVTENRYSKINSGNGNVGIDNNDNQFVDMKKDGDKEKSGDLEKAENLVCVDSKEKEVLKGPDTSNGIAGKEIISPENGKGDDGNDQRQKYSILYNAKIVNECKDIGDDLKIIYTEDLDVVIEDSDSDNGCTKNKAKDKIKKETKNQPLDEFKVDTAVKTMELINITKDSMEWFNKEPVHGIIKHYGNDVIKKDDPTVAINKDVSEAVPEIFIRESMAAINKNESRTIIKNESNSEIKIGDAADVINKDESEVAINKGQTSLNKVESSKDVKVAQIKEGTSDNPSDVNIVKDNLVIMTDCHRINKENLVLSEKFCDTQPVAPSQVQTVSTGTESLYDKGLEIRNVRIQYTDHPIRKLTTEQIKKIQMHISNCIKLASELPLLKCHGVQNGALFYTCYTKKTYEWLLNTISVASYVKVYDTKEVTKMALKLCGYFDFDSNYLFKMLEMYNKDISTKEWIVEKTEKNGGYIFFIVKMDKFSIKFIQESDFALFAGIDKVHFNLVWE